MSEARTIENGRKTRAVMLAAVAVTLGGMVCPHVAKAATWSATPGSSDWNTGSNWVGGTAPVAAGSSATFDSSATTAINLSAPVTVNTIDVNVAGYTFSGSTLTLAGAATITANADATINSNISGSAGLNKAGAGKLTLVGTNNFTGGTTISGGTISISGSAPTGAGSLPGAITLLDGATLEYTGGNGGFNRSFVLGAGQTTLSAAGAANGSGLNTNGGFTFTGSGARTLILNASSTLSTGSTLQGALGDGTGGATSLRKTGVGTWTLSGVAKTYTGDTAVDAGTLTVVAANVLPSATTAKVNSGAILRVNADQTIAALQDGASGGGTIQNSASSSTSTLTVGSGSFSGKLQDGSAGRILALSKNTSGVLTLTGASTFTGQTQVREGTLIIGVNGVGSLGSGSAVTVAAGGTLGGSGTVNGTVAVSGGVAPGDSIGRLTVANDLTWNGAAAASAATDWKFELGASNTSDLLHLTGTGSDFLKGSGSVFRFDFGGASLSGTYTLVDWTGTTNFSPSDFSYTGLGGNTSGAFSFNGSSLVFTTSVPEPGALMAAAAVGVGLSLRRRAKSSS